MSERIGIVGAGAIGCVVGGLLSEAGYDVTLVDQWPEHVEAIRKTGLIVETRAREHRTHPTALHIHELQSVDRLFGLAFVAVKSYDTDWATALIASHTRPEGLFVDFQNGINDDRVAAIVGAHRTLGCVITIAAGLYVPGRAARTDDYGLAFKIGELEGGDTPRARRLVEIVQSVGECRLTTRLRRDRWSKLMLNCMTNPLSGLTGYGAKRLRSDATTRCIGIQIGAEVVRVARELGIEVDPVLGISPDAIVAAAEGRDAETVEAQIIEAGRAAGSAGRPSFLQDVMKGRRTEIDALNGYVSRRGRETGVATPFCDCITRLIEELGIGFDPDPRHIEPLVTMLP
jgi:2-dehydropantoate 2-reductase